MATTPTHPISSFVILLNRLSLGLYFAIAGYRKIFVVGVSEFVAGSFAKSTPSWLPDWVATPYGYALPFLELIAGVMLALGLFSRLSALAIVLTLGSIIAAIGPTDPPKPYHANVIFFTLAVMLMMIGPGGFSVDRYVWSRKSAKVAGKVS